jgi:hypothetical protein
MSQGKAISLEGDVLSIVVNTRSVLWAGLVLLLGGIAVTVISMAVVLFAHHFRIYHLLFLVLGPGAALLGLLLLVFARSIAGAATYHFDRQARVVRRGNGSQAIFVGISHLQIDETEHRMELMLMLKNGKRWIIQSASTEEAEDCRELKKLCAQIVSHTGIEHRE